MVTGERKGLVLASATYANPVSILETFMPSWRTTGLISALGVAALSAVNENLALFSGSLAPSQWAQRFRQSALYHSTASFTGNARTYLSRSWGNFTIQHPSAADFMKHAGRTGGISFLAGIIGQRLMMGLADYAGWTKPDSPHYEWAVFWDQWGAMAIDLSVWIALTEAGRTGAIRTNHPSLMQIQRVGKFGFKLFVAMKALTLYAGLENLFSLKSTEVKTKTKPVSSPEAYALLELRQAAQSAEKYLKWSFREGLLLQAVKDDSSGQTDWSLLGSGSVSANPILYDFQRASHVLLLAAKIFPKEFGAYQDMLEAAYVPSREEKRIIESALEEHGSITTALETEDSHFAGRIRRESFIARLRYNQETALLKHLGLWEDAFTQETVQSIQTQQEARFLHDAYCADLLHSEDEYLKCRSSDLPKEALENPEIYKQDYQSPPSNASPLKNSLPHGMTDIDNRFKIKPSDSQMQIDQKTKTKKPSS